MEQIGSRVLLASGALPGSGATDTHDMPATKSKPMTVKRALLTTRPAVWVLLQYCVEPDAEVIVKGSKTYLAPTFG